MQGLLWLGLRTGTLLLNSINQSKCQRYPKDLGGGKELQSLLAKGVGTGRPFTGAIKAISSKYHLCPSFFPLRAYFLSLKALLNLLP